MACAAQVLTRLFRPVRKRSGPIGAFRQIEWRRRRTQADWFCQSANIEAGHRQDRIDHQRSEEPGLTQTAVGIGGHCAGQSGFVDRIRCFSFVGLMLVIMMTQMPGRRALLVLTIARHRCPRCLER